MHGYRNLSINTYCGDAPKSNFQGMHIDSKDFSKFEHYIASTSEYFPGMSSDPILGTQHTSILEIIVTLS